METPPSVAETVKDFIIKSDKNKEFILNLKIIESNLEISITSINEIPNILYRKKYSLEQVILVNKYFSLCQNINEAYQVIIDKLDSKSYELKELIDSVSLTIISNDKLCGNYIFDIPLNKKTEREDINDIYELIKKLKSENIELSKENKEIKENYKNEIKLLKEELEKLKKENLLIKNTSNQNYENFKKLLNEYKKDFDNLKQFGFPSHHKNPKNNCGNSSVQFFQTHESYEGSEKDWAHYIVLNHGNGNDYYQVVIRFPFYSGHVQIGHRESNSWKGWKNLINGY